jgi:hypothetical protein
LPGVYLYRTRTKVQPRVEGCAVMISSSEMPRFEAKVDNSFFDHLKMQCIVVMRHPYYFVTYLIFGFLLGLSEYYRYHDILYKVTYPPINNMEIGIRSGLIGFFLSSAIGICIDAYQNLKKYRNWQIKTFVSEQGVEIEVTSISTIYKWSGFDSIKKTMTMIEFMKHNKPVLYYSRGAFLNKHEEQIFFDLCAEKIAESNTRTNSQPA